MTILWIVASLLLAGALLLLLPSLLRLPAREPDAADAALDIHHDHRQEIERDLAAGSLAPNHVDQVRAEIDRWEREDAASASPAAAVQTPALAPALMLALLIPLGSVAVYLHIGDPNAAVPQVPAAAATSTSTEQRHGLTPEQIQQMVTALAERLKAQPDDTDGWLMLGRSYTVLGRHQDAATALRRAAALAPGDPSVLADLADAVGMAQGRRLAGEPMQWVQKALDIDPEHVKALALAGSVAFEAKDHAAARRYWERLLAVVPNDSAIARSVRGSLDEAIAMASGITAAPAGDAAASPAPTVVVAAADRTISGRVEIAPALAQRFSGGDTLFVFARAVDGPRMPLAILKRDAALPAAFTLDDAMAMSPQLRLSGFSEVVVMARVSKTGNATPQSGDLIGQSAPVRPGVSDLRVVIDSVQP
jgi:cytochrome c-type biogenesis protein CcmH